MTPLRRLALAGLVAAALPASEARAREPLRLRVSPALDACGRALARAYESSGHAVRLDAGDQGDLAAADVVIADSAELLRPLESGRADESLAMRLGEVPWVTVSPADEPAPGALRSFASAGVAVLGGPPGREARA